MNDCGYTRPTYQNLVLSSKQKYTSHCQNLDYKKVLPGGVPFCLDKATPESEWVFSYSKQNMNLTHLKQVFIILPCET